MKQSNLEVMRVAPFPNGGYAVTLAAGCEALATRMSTVFFYASLRPALAMH